MDYEYSDYCGTPALNALLDAQDAFHAGKPIPKGIEIEELTIIIHDEKLGSMRVSTGDGEDTEFDIPKMTVEGTGEVIQTNFVEFYEQVSSLPPHLACLKVRRFAFSGNHFNSIFEIL